MANAWPVELTLVQPASRQPDAETVMHQNFHPSGTAVGEQISTVRLRRTKHRDQQTVALPAFIPLEVTPVESKQKTEASAIIELPLGQQVLTIKWPTSDPDGCARFIRGVAR